ncbi:hypothetical protein [uncultured Mediterranean phage uvMED]|jgi:hypothetical protein|nr:hypothetical protein [uncultured Mediterranean phage uvMED]BAR13886.1 hypothetical protein [uncultured Mediterranean phage uvMED]
MTYTGIFDEVECNDKLKDCKNEIQRHKRFIEKQASIIKSLELEIEQKDNEILLLKNK